MKKLLLACVLVVPGAVIAAIGAQQPFREYPSVEYGESIPLPPDWNKRAEFISRAFVSRGPVDSINFTADSRVCGKRAFALTQDYPRRIDLAACDAPLDPR